MISEILVLASFSPASWESEAHNQPFVTLISRGMQSVRAHRSAVRPLSGLKAKGPELSEGFEAGTGRGLTENWKQSRRTGSCRICCTTMSKEEVRGGGRGDRAGGASGAS